MDNKKYYLIKVHCYHPYKIETEERIQASNPATALARGIKLFRKDPRIKGKRVEEFMLSVRRIN